MQIFGMFFLKMSLTPGIVIIVVLLVRLLLKGLPKNYTYMLWLVVAFRLGVPFSADSNISIFNLPVIMNTGSATSAGSKTGIKQNSDSLYNTNGYSAWRAFLWSSSLQFLRACYNVL